jgi:anti-sigma B factor antagonist
MAQRVESSNSGVAVSTRERDGVVILDLSGKLMGGPESDPLREMFRRLSDQGTRKVIVNLRKVPWMNSSGLGVLLAAFIQIRKAGGAVKFAGLQDRVQGILTTTKLVTMIETWEDEEAALRSFQSR